VVLTRDCAMFEAWTLLPPVASHGFEVCAVLAAVSSFVPGLDSERHAAVQPGTDAEFGASKVIDGDGGADHIEDGERSS